MGHYMYTLDKSPDTKLRIFTNVESRDKNTYQLECWLTNELDKSLRSGFAI